MTINLPQSEPSIVKGDDGNVDIVDALYLLQARKHLLEIYPRWKGRRLAMNPGFLNIVADPKKVNKRSKK